ncbi:hypothetical protein Bca52824_024123 [Brassica carinata]|uniref:Uncharacterized protein n=1 Tax=Brassica carinata TaxID=52824 RepID=A0A8X7VJT2_BRACI|nr:hypothetical protein Bca52824_024123 [Brassica carinata]
MEPSADGWRIRDRNVVSRVNGFGFDCGGTGRACMRLDAVAYVIGPSGCMNARIGYWAWTIRATDGSRMLITVYDQFWFGALSMASVLSDTDGWLETKLSLFDSWSCGDGWLSD